MDLTIVGSGDAFSSGGFGQTCLHVVSARSPGALKTTFLIDCGATALEGLSKLSIETSEIDAIFITHLHGDHIGGLPYIILRMMFQDQRTRPLELFGPPELEQTYTKLMELMYVGVARMERQFEMHFHVLLPDVPKEWRDLTISAFDVVHPIDPAYALRISNGVKTIAYSGDSEWCENLLAAGDNADLYVLECDGYDRPIPGHNYWVELKTHLPRFRTDQIVLTHLGPDARANAYQMGDKGLLIAEDGMKLSV